MMDLTPWPADIAAWEALPAYVRAGYPYRTLTEFTTARRVNQMFLKAQAAMWSNAHAGADRCNQPTGECGPELGALRGTSPAEAPDGR